MEENKNFGNESFGIPKDYTKKQKFNLIKLIFYIVVVAVVCVVGYRGYKTATDHLLPTVTFDKTQQPLIYQRLSDITLKTVKNQSYTAGTVTGDIDSQVKIAQKGTTVFYISKDNNLCVSTLFDGQIMSEEIVLDSAVTDFKINPDGKFVVYRRGDMLCVSDLVSSKVIANSVEDYYLSKNNQKIIFYKSDKSIYTCGTSRGETPVLIDTDVTKIVSDKSHYTVMYYIKDSILYKKEFDSPRMIMAENVIDAIMLGDFVYFTTEELYEKRFTEIFYDDTATKDAKLSYPDPDDFTYTQSGATLFDAEGYQEALTEYEHKIMRDAIRKNYTENPSTVNGYSLYLCERNTNRRVDTYLESPHLVYNTCRDAILYRRYDNDIYRPKTSRLNSLAEANNYIISSLATQMDVDMYLLRKNKHPYQAFEEFPDGPVTISLDVRYIYCIENEKDGYGELIRYDVTNKNLRGRKVIAKNISDYYVDGADSSTTIAFSGDRLGIFTDGKFTYLSDKSYREFFFVDGAFFYFDDYDYTLKTGTLKTFRNGKPSVVDTGVREFNVRNYNTVSYIKNYNPDMNVGNLYVKSGRVKKKEDICVAAIIN